MMLLAMVVVSCYVPLCEALLAPIAQQLKHDGFAVLPDASVGADLVKAVSDECSARLDLLLDAADDSGCNVIEQQYSFREICHRKRLRWDVRMPDSAAWQELCARAVEAATPVVHEACGAGVAEGGGAPPLRVLMTGAVISRPGAGAQSFHADGEDRLFNIFVPLVDIAPESDGTQFWPRSQHADPAMEKVLALPEDPAAMEAMVSPGCAAGGLLVFDYRCIHRGLPSLGRERAVAYIVVSVDDAAADNKNFPELSVHDAAPEHTEYIPFFEDSVGDVWRSQLPRLTSAMNRLQQKMASGECFPSDPAQAKRKVKASIREFCRANGLDEHSIQSQIQAARALLI